MWHHEFLHCRTVFVCIHCTSELLPQLMRSTVRSEHAFFCSEFMHTNMISFCSKHKTCNCISAIKYDAVIPCLCVRPISCYLGATLCDFPVWGNHPTYTPKAAGWHKTTHLRSKVHSAVRRKVARPSKQGNTYTKEGSALYQMWVWGQPQIVYTVCAARTLVLCHSTDTLWGTGRSDGTSVDQLQFRLPDVKNTLVESISRTSEWIRL